MFVILWWAMGVCVSFEDTALLTSFCVRVITSMLHLKPSVLLPNNPLSSPSKGSPNPLHRVSRSFGFWRTL